MMKTFLLIAFCLLVVTHEVHPLPSLGIGLSLGPGPGLGLEIHLGPCLPIKVEARVIIGLGPVQVPTYNNWTVLMQRFNGSEDFNRNWSDYRNGFGDKEGGEFWLGNEIIHRLTKEGNYTLRVEVQVDNTNLTWFYAEYDTFSIDTEANRYALHLSGYKGDAGDSLANTSLPEYFHHNGTRFSTADSDSDGDLSYNCADLFQAGWWFNECYQACLTCPYRNQFVWSFTYDWETTGELLVARMMTKRK